MCYWGPQEIPHLCGQWFNFSLLPGMTFQNNYPMSKVLLIEKLKPSKMIKNIFFLTVWIVLLLADSLEQDTNLEPPLNPSGILFCVRKIFRKKIIKKGYAHSFPVVFVIHLSSINWHFYVLILHLYVHSVWRVNVREVEINMRS